MAVPDPGLSIVVDTASVMDAASVSSAAAVLQQLNLATNAQVKILTIPSLQGGDIVDFTQHEFDLWKLGAKGKDDGVLIVFARDDRKVRIEPGYGLEGVLTDAWCGQTIRAVIDQYFRQQDYGGGLDALAQAVAARIAQEHGVSLTGAQAPVATDASRFQPHIGIIIFLVLVAIAVLRTARGASDGRWRSGYVGFGSGGSFGGGFSSGGGGGGFSGGGGSSGGGGASGSW